VDDNTGLQPYRSYRTLQGLSNENPTNAMQAEASDRLKPQNGVGSE